MLIGFFRILLLDVYTLLSTNLNFNRVGIPYPCLRECLFLYVYIPFWRALYLVFGRGWCLRCPLALRRKDS